MRLGRSLTALGLAVALAIPGGVTPVSAQEPVVPPAGEVFFATPPEGWVLGFSHKDKAKRHEEYIPAGQRVQNWTEMVTVQVFYGLGTQAKGNLDLRGYVLFIAKNTEEKCRETKVEPPLMSRVGSHESATIAIVCKDPDRTKYPPQAVMKNYEFLMLRAIQGRDALYVVQRAWHDDTERDAPLSSSATLKEWGAFFNRIEICDARDPAPVCRTLGLLSPTELDDLAKSQSWRAADGCAYLRTLTVAPDVRKPLWSVSVLMIALGKDPFNGKADIGRRTLEMIAKPVGENRAVVVVAGVSPVAAASSGENIRKAETDIAAMRDSLVEGGINASRILIRPNPTCRVIG